MVSAAGQGEPPLGVAADRVVERHLEDHHRGGREGFRRRASSATPPSASTPSVAGSGMALMLSMPTTPLISVAAVAVAA